MPKRNPVSETSQYITKEQSPIRLALKGKHLWYSGVYSRYITKGQSRIQFEDMNWFNNIDKSHRPKAIIHDHTEPNYALIMTADSRLLPGVHAMLNASVYYGFHDKIEFHLLYWPGPEMFKFIADMQASGHYPNFTAVNLLEYKEREGPEEQRFKPVYYLKFYRSLYASRIVSNYDAVGFMDADMCIVGDISPYFRLAHEADRICMVDWKYNQKRVDSNWYIDAPTIPGVHNTSGAPYDPCATFFTPKWSQYFEIVHKLGPIIGKQGGKNSEMPTMNCMIITLGLLEEIIRLPCIRWTNRRWNISTEWVNPDGIYQMLITEPDIHESGNVSPFIPHLGKGLPEIEGVSIVRLNSMLAIHGRWHFRATLQKKTCRGQMLQRHRAREQNQNVANIWEAFKFFNFECYTRLEPWKAEWGAYNEYIDVSSGLLLKDAGKEIVT